MKFRFPFATMLILAVNITVFVFTTINPKLLNNMACSLGVVYSWEYWRLITACFAHSGYSHIIYNMMGCLVISCLIEFKIGFKRMILYVLFIGIFANFIGMMSSGIAIGPKALMQEGRDVVKYVMTGGIGYSGVVSGLKLLVLVVYRDWIIEKGTKLTYWILLSSGLGFFLYQFYLMCHIQSNTGFTTHIGGAIAGVICGYYFLYHNLRRKNGKKKIGLFKKLFAIIKSHKIIGSTIGVLALIAIIALYVIYGKDSCKCHKLGVKVSEKEVVESKHAKRVPLPRVKATKLIKI